MTTADLPARLGALAHTLWRERHLLEACLYRVECQQLMAEVGRSRWRERAAFDVEVAFDRLREHGLVRDVQVSALAADLGLAGDACLSELAAHAPEPWPAILADHRRALEALLGRLDVLPEGSRELARRSVALVRPFVGGSADAGIPVHHAALLAPPVAAG